MSIQLQWKYPLRIAGILGILCGFKYHWLWMGDTAKYSYSSKCIQPNTIQPFSKTWLSISYFMHYEVL